MTIYSSYHRRSSRGSIPRAGGLDGGIIYGSYTKTSTGAIDAASSTGGGSSKRRRKMAFAAVYGCLGLLAVYTNVLDFQVPTTFKELRRQLSRALSRTECISNIYMEVEEYNNLPHIPTTTEGYLPSYIKLCYEWMRREAYPGTQYTALKVLENKDICVDYTAPHYAMLEIIASQILGTAITNLGMSISYDHMCADHRASDEALVGFDWTTLQMVYQEASMGVNAEAMCK